MRNNAEETLQRSIVQFLRLKGKPNLIWWHTPNGESRSVRTGVRLKMMGVLPGVPDLTFIHEGDVSFMELKAPKKYLTPEQKDFKEKADWNGCGYALVRDIDEAVAKLKEWEFIK